MNKPRTVAGRKKLATRWAFFSLVAIAIVLFIALAVLKPAMPDRIVLLTGPEDSAYHALGERIAAGLHGRGLDAEVVVTRGGFDNMVRLGAGKKDTVAFAPSSIGDDAGEQLDTADFVSLGSVELEPLWLFFRAALEIERVADLSGHVVATGGKGTIGHFVAEKLIEMNGVTGEVTFVSVEGRVLETIEKDLLGESVDAAFLTGSPRSPVVRELLENEDLRFLSFDRADAYEALIPGVTAVVAPEGVFDLERNAPSEDARLLCATTNLVAHDSLHAAVPPILLDVVAGLPERETYFASGVRFPADRHLAFPLDRSAQRFFERGETGLSKYLPYRVTRYLNHLGFVVIPLLAVTLVLLRVVPGGLRVWGQLRLKGLFKHLAVIEKAHASGADRSKLLDDLDRLDRASAHMFVPRSVVHDYVDFRQFLHDMRERVQGS